MGDIFMVLSKGMSSSVTLAGRSGGSGAADVVGQPNEAGDNVEELGWTRCPPPG